MANLKIPVSANDHIQGLEDAPITLVEYGDYQCPVCGYAYPIVKRVQKKFGKELRFVFRNFPLTEIHPLAELAALFAEYADMYNQFWTMHDLIYENQTRLSQDTLIELSESLQLPVADVESVLKTGKLQERLKHDFLGGVRSGVNGTPTFYINGVRHNDSFEYDILTTAIEESMMKR